MATPHGIGLMALTTGSRLGPYEIDGPLGAMVPHVAGLFLLTANHVIMHTGQFSVVRRKLGKPVKF